MWCVRRPRRATRRALRPARALIATGLTCASTAQPPAVAAVQEPLLAVPLDELGRALTGFARPPGDGKPDLAHWLPLLNRLDELLERAAARPDVALTGASAEPFPTDDVVAALRVSAALLDCSHNRQLYGSSEVRRVARGARVRAARARGAPRTGPC